MKVRMITTARILSVERRTRVARVTKSIDGHTQEFTEDLGWWITLQDGCSLGIGPNPCGLQVGTAKLIIEQHVAEDGSPSDDITSKPPVK